MLGAMALVEAELGEVLAEAEQLTELDGDAADDGFGSEVLSYEPVVVSKSMLQRDLDSIGLSLPPLGGAVDLPALRGTGAGGVDGGVEHRPVGETLRFGKGEVEPLRTGIRH